MKTYQFTHHIAKEKEGSYYLLPFSLDESADILTVRYSYPKKDQGRLGRVPDPCIIDLGLTGPEGEFLGWSGSSRREVTVSEADSTEGYLTRSVIPGTWSVIVGAYKVPLEGVDVIYKISLSSYERSLYMGDTHVHSTASDGKLNIAELAVKAQKKGLSFLCLANHNNYSENFSLPHINGLSFIPSVEWTHYKGHMNFFGVKAPFRNNFTANTKEEMTALLNDARSMGAVISVNHPDCPLCPYLWEEDNYDMVEVWNGPMTDRNRKAIRRWTALLKAGRITPLVGGSDFHRPHDIARLGHPTLGLLSLSSKPEHLLEAMKNGHSFVTCGPKGPGLLLRFREAVMGDTISRPEGTAALTFDLQKSRCGLLKIEAVTDKGTFSVRGYNVSLPADISFVYLMGTRLGLPRVITNPIYVRDPGKV